MSLIPDSPGSHARPGTPRNLVSPRGLLAVAGGCASLLLATALATPRPAQATEPVDLASLNSIVQTQLQGYADQLVGEPATGQSSLVNRLPLTTAESGVISAELSQLADRRSALNNLGLRFTSATVTTRVLSSTVSGDSVHMQVEEAAKLTYPAGYGADAYEYIAHHDVTFQTQDGTWALADERRSLEDLYGPLQDTQVMGAGDPTVPLSVNAAAVDPDPGDPLHPTRTSVFDCGVFGGCTVEDNAPDLPKIPSSTADPNGSPLPASVTLADVRTNPLVNNDLQRDSPSGSNVPAGLNYSKMKNYALQYAINRNTDYRDMGNNCTNFISQILREGGWKNDNGWYRSNSNWWYNWANQTYTWGGAENWSHFAPKRTDALPNPWWMSIVDILQFDYDHDDNMNHTMIVTGMGNSDMFMSYHTNNTKNRSLKAILSGSPNAWTYAYRT